MSEAAPDTGILSEAALVGAALALGAPEVPGWSPEETALARAAAPAEPLAPVRASIGAGADPLGDAFCRLRGPELRRAEGATYTPPPIVDAMVAWAASRPRPSRVVDPGAGSGRFAVAAGRRFPAATIWRSSATRWRRSCAAATWPPPGSRIARG